jgi:pimeloyl-ACP methyl ester carboxylesterase
VTAQAYLDPPFGRLAEFEACAETPSARADLRLYTTPIAMDDLNEVREALGYATLNLSGGSYGSRAALVYMRRHPQTVRTAVINGIAPIAFTNPLYHFSEAQKALDRTLAECAEDAACSSAFPDLRNKFNELIVRLEREPATVEITDPDWGEAAASNLPDSLHLVIPGAHGVGGPCTQSIIQAFVASGSLSDLDTACIAVVELPPFPIE